MGSGGSTFTRLELKGIDGMTPQGVEHDRLIALSRSIVWWCMAAPGWWSDLSGDRLRLTVRTGARGRDLPWIFQAQPQDTLLHERGAAFQDSKRCPCLRHFKRRPILQNETTASSGACGHGLQDRHCVAASFPCSQDRLTRVQLLLTREPSPLRLQYSPLNIRYYNQDLHYRAVSEAHVNTFAALCTHSYSYHGFSIPEYGRLWVDHLSIIHFRDRFIRQVSCDTLIIGCRLPWPPSCCLYEPNPLWDLMSEHSCTLSHLSVHPASPVLLTRSGPHRARILLQSSMK
eukprot:gene23296-biopygen10326